MSAKGGAVGVHARALGLGFLLPASILVVWQALGMASGNPRTPVPTHVVSSAIDLVASAELPLAILQSLMRVFAGFAVAAAIAVPLGLAMGAFRSVDRNVDPLVESFRPIAAIAILPLAILWLGTGTAAAVMIVAYAAFFPIVINTTAGATRAEARRACSTRSTSPAAARAARRAGSPSA